jgi:hypothetical protein
MGRVQWTAANRHYRLGARIGMSRERSYAKRSAGRRIFTFPVEAI